MGFFKKEEFKPDKPRSGFWSKLFLTQKQRASLLKWGLYALVLVVLSVVQDVLFSRWRISGATTELVPCGIFLICLAEGMEKGCIFSLIASCCYVFSGSAAGNQAIVFITALSIFATFFRQSYLRKGFGASALCVSLAMLVYEAAIFFIALFLGLTNASRFLNHLLTAGLTLISVPILYPIVNGISTIGGDAWKE